MTYHTAVSNETFSPALVMGTDGHFAALLFSLSFGLVIVLMYMMASAYHHRFEPVTERPMVVRVHNAGRMPYTVEDVVVPDGGVTEINVRTNTSLKAKGRHSDGTEVIHSHRVTREGDVFLTPSGFRSPDEISTNVALHNTSSFTVIFVEVGSRGERRWGSNVVAPGAVSEHKVVASRSRWQVVRPSEENKPLSEAVVYGKVAALVFNGTTLQVDAL